MHCLDCEDFDYCWACYQTAKAAQDPTHAFTVYRFAPSEGSRLAQEQAQGKLAGASWQWCRYHGDPSTCARLDDETSFRFHMVKFYRKRCPLRTRAGRLGLGPQSVKPGDAVFLLAGARTPYIVRRLDGDEQVRDRFRFLGEA